MDMNEAQYKLDAQKMGYLHNAPKPVKNTKNRLLLAVLLTCAVTSTSSVLLVKQIVDGFTQDMRHVEAVADRSAFILSKFRFDLTN